MPSPEDSEAAAPPHRVFRIRTEDVPPKDRFDYWRAQFPGVDMRPAAAKSSRPYSSESLVCMGDDGVLFARMRSDPTVSRFREDQNDRIMLSILTRGRIRTSDDRGQEILLDPAEGFILQDCRVASRTDSPSGHSGLHLSLPRILAQELLGARPCGDKSVRNLPKTVMGDLLSANLRALARHGAQLDSVSAGHAMQALSCLTVAYLAQVSPGQDEEKPDALQDSRFLAATRYIDARIADPRLSATHVAAALGCSRTTLHRLFARHGRSVTEHIRDARLAHGRRLLADPARSIGDVALLSGYGDLPAFSKAFRRRFGMSPRDWRAEAGAS